MRLLSLAASCLIAHGAWAAVAAVCGLAEASPISMNEVFAPVVVGVPPCDAARELCVTADGEIRHYGHHVADGKVIRVYMASRDNGLNWTTVRADPKGTGALVKVPWRDDLWLGFEDHKSLKCVRSSKGPGDVAAERVQLGDEKMELRQIVFLAGRRRVVAAFSQTDGKPRLPNGTTCYHATVLYSDDDGRTWARVLIPTVPDVERLSPGDRRPHWYNDGCEPTIVELKDGTLLMAVRTSGSHVAFSRSRDGGKTWDAWTTNPAFWQANTMPYFFRLKDGRLLFVWNNTQMLPTRDLANYPELSEGEASGEWESAFTNRDALHAAISEDDGRTWIGFREVALNAVRASADFRELGNDISREWDKSVHQTQALELPDGKVMLAFGQNVAARRIVIFDPQWLYERSRSDDFHEGLGNLSTHLYVKSLSGGWRGWSGHCAWNRVSGALLVRDPDTGRDTKREVLQLCRIADPRLVSDRQGIVWNFPAARKGRFETECRIDGAGFRLALTDHWINPCDEFNPPRAPVVSPITAELIGGRVWHKLAVEWDLDRKTARVVCDGKTVAEPAVVTSPPFGLSYVHLQTLAEGTDAQGAYFRSFFMTHAE